MNRVVVIVAYCVLFLLYALVNAVAVGLGCGFLAGLASLLLETSPREGFTMGFAGGAILGVILYVVMVLEGWRQLHERQRSQAVLGKAMKEFYADMYKMKERP